MPILGYDRFKRMISFTKTKIPEFIFTELEPIKSDDSLVQKYGVEFGVKQTKDLIEHGFRFIHYYTMNLEKSILEIVAQSGIRDT